jgi:hypothetical protein
MAWDLLQIKWQITQGVWIMRAKDLISILRLVLFLILVGCSGGTDTGSGGPTATLVSVSVTPANASIPMGVTKQFAASGTYSDRTTHDITAQVTWSSSNTLTATVNSSGLATAVAAGTATITAASGNISGNTTLTVTLAGTISLAWDPPTTNADGSPLTDLSGYQIYYGTASGTYDSPIDVGNVTTYTLTGLTKGQTYYIVVIAYDTFNDDSDSSNEVSGIAK